MIYLDHAASSPLSVKAAEALEKSLLSYANPSSNHALGRALMREIEEWKIKILQAFRLSPNEYRLIFTSSATESNNLAIKGVAEHYRNRGQHLVSSVLEHPSVTAPFKSLEKSGYHVTYLSATPEGRIDLRELSDIIDKETTLVSIIGVNNEIGSINDIESIAQIVHRFPKAFLHSDMTQAIGKTPFDYGALDLFSWGAHKFGGPKGVGGLILKKNIQLNPLLDGGEQEYGFRSSTLNYPLIVSASVAIIEALSLEKQREKEIKEVSDYLRSLLSKNPEISINSPLDSSPYIINVSLKTRKASVVMEALSQEGIYLSSVSACNSKGEPVSSILLSIGKSHEEAANSLRISLGPDTSKEEIDLFVKALNDILERIIHR